MARRYSRDNRGRFASGGTSATARGGRLKTASGNKRATQTTKAAAAKPSGSIAGKVKRNPAAAGKIGQAKAQTQVSSARQAATDRLKIKTATRRKLSADRESVIPSTPKGPKTMRAQRVGSTVPKSIARTKGNTKAQVASRVQRKTAVNRANLAAITRAERTGAAQGRQYERTLKRGMTLQRAQSFLQTGKLPGRDNSITAQRSLRQSKDRLAAKNAARAAAAKPAAPKAAKPAPKVDVNSFNAMKRRYDRTKFENSGLTFNTSDRPRGTKQLITGINRKRAFGIYRAQAARPLNELTQQKARAPFGKFSTVKNPAPAKAFPSQAPGRTKAAEAKAREYRKAAKRPKKK